MNIQRLKFAWARGARIQWLSPERPPQTLYNWPLEYTESMLGVHPDDEDLQYGPLSTALREMALYRIMHDRWTVERCYQDAACLLVDKLDPRGMNANLEDDVTLPTFLLFYAELLADEGL
jgi:hypothetical protein